LIEVPDMISFL